MMGIKPDRPVPVGAGLVSHIIRLSWIMSGTRQGSCDLGVGSGFPGPVPKPDALPSLCSYAMHADIN